MNKQVLLVLVFAVLIGFSAFSAAEAMPMLPGWPGGAEASPAIAALLSLMPMPAALGQFYAGNWGTGLGLSFLEVAEVGAAAVVFAYEGGAMMSSGVPIPRWSTTGQVVFFSALGGFVLTKFVDAFIAASTVDAMNVKNAGAKVSLVVGDRGAGVSLAFHL